MRLIEREIAPIIVELSKSYGAIMVYGARQVGKTTLLQNLSKKNREYVTLDDLSARSLAKNDPAMFFQIHRPPILIDEVQYAPELFSYIKMEIDQGAAPGSFWLTGSQSFSMMRLAQESLAGRVAILQMPSLSQREIHRTGKGKEFSLDLGHLKNQEKRQKPCDVKRIYERILEGSLPGYISGRYTNREVFYRSYLQTYVERDVSELIPSVDKLRFLDFIRAAACRTGELLNIHSIARDVDVADQTAKHWLDVLVASNVVFLLRPYSNNLLKRTVKAPKLYFMDTGLVTFLTRYTSAEILMNGAINGAILENYVVSEIMKSFFNRGLDAPLWYYRDFDQDEVDIVFEKDGEFHPIEIKKKAIPDHGDVKCFKKLKSPYVKRGIGAVICMAPQVTAIDSETLVIPVSLL